LAQQNQRPTTSKLSPQFYSPSPEDFFGTSDPVEQRQQLKVKALLLNASMASAYIQGGGTWQDWVDQVTTPACNAVKSTTEIFTQAVNGDKAAIAQIATSFGLSIEEVQNNLSESQEVRDAGEAMYAEHLTFDKLVPAITSGLGLLEA
jgi:hypothetical protein